MAVEVNNVWLDYDMVAEQKYGIDNITLKL